MKRDPDARTVLSAAFRRTGTGPSIGRGMNDSLGYVLGLATMGFIGGLMLFVRGLVAYRRDRLISAVATSSLDGLAAGEVRVTGVVQAIGQQLISPLQSRPCVWYRARIDATDDSHRVLLDEERAVHFRVADERGTVRVVPRGARWEVDVAFDESTSLTGAEPPGLDQRHGAGYGLVMPDDPGDMTAAQRQAAIDSLLTVRLAGPSTPDRGGRRGNDGLVGASATSGEGGSFDVNLASGGGLLGASLASAGGGSFDVNLAPSSGLLGASLASGGRRYRESRLEVGERVTILGQALPWSDVRGQMDLADRGGNVERDMAGDLAAAREAGLLAGSPGEAWGNAAIPGFGIGRPTRPPELDPAVRPPDPQEPIADEQHAERFDIPEDELVVARTAGELVIYRGSPAVATRQHDSAFLLGLVGAVMVVCCTLALVAALTGSV